MSDCIGARGPAHEDNAELPSHPLERANDPRKDLHSGHLCPGLVGGWNRGGGQKDRQWREGGRHGGKEWGGRRRDRERGRSESTPHLPEGPHPVSDSPGVPGVPGRGT